MSPQHSLQGRTSRKSMLLRFFDSHLSKVMILYTTVFWYSASGFLFFELEHHPEYTWTDASWWALVTMTTVGYGDFFPQSSGGRYLVAIPAMLVGIGILSFIISEVSAKLVEARSKKSRGMIPLRHQEHIVIVNFSSAELAKKIILELRADALTQDSRICIVDQDLAELPTEISRMDIDFVQGNPTHKETLERANLGEAQHVIVLARDPKNIHSDDTSLAIILMIKNINPKASTIVELLDPEKSETFSIAGADSVVCNSELSANLLIQELQDPGVKNIINTLTSNQHGEQFYICDIKLSRDHTYTDLVTWSLDHGYSSLGLQRQAESVLNPTPSESILNGDRAILIGKKRPALIVL